MALLRKNPCRARDKKPPTSTQLLFFVYIDGIQKLPGPKKEPPIVESIYRSHKAGRTDLAGAGNGSETDCLYKLYLRVTEPE